MSSLLSRAPISLQNAIRNVQNDDKYRYLPLYSLLLMLTIRAIYSWPLTDKLLVIYREYPWILDFEYLAVSSALVLSLFLGFVGILRRGWLPKLLSAYAIYYAGPMLLWNFSQYVWWDWFGLWMDFTWYAFDVPIAWIHQHVGTDAFARTSLYAVYLLVIYLLLRPLGKCLWRIVLRIEEHLIDRYPFMMRWKRPVL